MKLPDGVMAINPAAMTKKDRTVYFKPRQKFVAHNHFIKGVQVNDSNCNYCVGVIKPKPTEAALAEKWARKKRYYEEWKRNQRKAV